MSKHLESQVEFFLQEVLLTRASDAAVRLVVAYSGGLDSLVLLYMLNNIVMQRADLSLIALHVNHGLQAEADNWQAHCLQQARELNINITSFKVSVSRDGGESLEEAARHARYRAFGRFMQSGDLLCLAHHQDDQAETLMYRLLRGSGPLGLASMSMRQSFESGELIRPLLACSRAELEEYAGIHKLVWLDDPSNNDQSFDRNFLRHQVMPLLSCRWPAAKNTIARSAALCGDTVLLLDEIAELDLQGVQNPSGKTLAQGKLALLSSQRINNVLRYWLRREGYSLPSRKNLNRICDELLGDALSGLALVSWGGVEVRSYQGSLYCMEAASLVDSERKLVWPEAELVGGLALGEGVGSITCREVRGEGFCAERFDRAVALGDLTVRWRQGGERCHPAGRGRSQSLKKLFQEYAVPPWRRDSLPLIYVGQELAAVPGLWVCEGFTAEEGTRAYIFDFS
ncbi:MAG: tRNA lysidine(34) synthetase TilS [Gammaproteobacteria bacterium]|nr:tRNA lysidine(34) synthetase TilS [Gammaproteobacteria bacterium]